MTHHISNTGNSLGHDEKARGYLEKYCYASQKENEMKNGLLLRLVGTREAEMDVW